jgi:hypothetical protein
MPPKAYKRVSRKKTSPASTSRKRPILPEKQWAMPAGFCADGLQPATLSEVVDPKVPTLELSNLSLEQRAELVVKRLELQPQIDLAMIGAGVIDKSRAITEVKNLTKVGKLLIAIENQMIRNLIEKALKQKSNYRGRNAKSKTNKKRPIPNKT